MTAYSAWGGEAVSDLWTLQRTFVVLDAPTLEVCLRFTPGLVLWDGEERFLLASLCAFDNWSDKLKQKVIQLRTRACSCVFACVCVEVRVQRRQRVSW